MNDAVGFLCTVALGALLVIFGQMFRGWADDSFGEPGPAEVYQAYWTAFYRADKEAALPHLSSDCEPEIAMGLVSVALDEPTEPPDMGEWLWDELRGQGRIAILQVTRPIIGSDFWQGVVKENGHWRLSCDQMAR